MDRDRLYKKGTDSCRVQRKVMRPLPRLSGFSVVPLGNMTGPSWSLEEEVVLAWRDSSRSQGEIRVLPLTQQWLCYCLSKSLRLLPVHVSNRDDGWLPAGVQSSQCELRERGLPLSCSKGSFT
jgi:hypothetical protein